MPYPLTITVQTLPDTPAVPVVLSLGFGGEQLSVALEPAGDGLLGRIELPAAPRYLRIQGDCGDQAQPHCLDELVLPGTVQGGRLHYAQIQDPDGPRLVRVGEPALPLWVGFGWGGLLLLGLGLWWWRGGRDAAS